MPEKWPIHKQSVSGHVAWLQDVPWLSIDQGWYLIWIPLEPYHGGVVRRKLPANWYLIGLA